MKRFYIAILLICGVLSVSAQGIVVAEFKHLPEDRSASLNGTERFDQNGERCALIRVQTTEKDFAFDVGMVGVVAVDQNRVGEIWVYVGNGAKRITIRHQQLGKVEYDFGMNLKKGETYELTLVTGRVETVVHEEILSQFLLFNVEPKDALLYVGDEVWRVENGQAQRFVPFGTYEYRVEAGDYHTEVGRVEVNDRDNAHVVNINLRPAFGWIEVSGNGVLNGADVYIDGQRVGKAPIRSERLSSGEHRVKVIQTLYKEFETEVTVTDNSVLPMLPQLEPNYADITIAAGDGVEILLNNERKGMGSWSGRLESGQYKIKAQRASHRPVERLLVVSPDMPEKNIRIEPLKPIVGNLTVTTTPAQATIYLDGEPMGQTPRLLRDVLIGSHSLTIKKEGYADVSATVEVAEGEMKQAGYTLSQRCTVTVDVNDTRMGSVTGSGQYNAGERVQLRASANSGYEFVEWSDGVKDEQREVSVNADMAYRAVFKEAEGYMMFTVGGVQFKMIKVDGGTFQMGATAEQGSDAYAWEKPVHSVTLSDYWIGEFEVTQELWQAVMGSNPSYFKGNDRPVENVSWEDITDKFLPALNRMLKSQLGGKKFYLPTEAQWEYAARGGGRSRGYKYAGSNNISNVAWYDENSEDKTHPIGQKLPNELGLYDMAGNVWEWCADWYGDYSSYSETNPTGAPSGSNRVIRGGSWYYIARDCRVSDRSYFNPSGRSSSSGYRLVLR